MKFAVIVAGILAILLSYIIHSPQFLGQYSDIVSVYVRVFIEGDRWYRDYVGLDGIVYLDYFLEYPPLIGLNWLISIYLSRLLAETVFDGIYLHYTASSIINYFFYVIYVATIVKLGRIMRSDLKGVLLSIASPSIIYYLTYNWDIMATSMAMTSLYYLYRAAEHSNNRVAHVVKSSIFLGLSMLAKLLTGVAMIIGLVFLYKIYRSDRYLRYMYAWTAITVFLVPIIIISLFSPRAVVDFINYHSNWYCENCFYIWLVSDIYDPFWRSVSQVLMVGTSLIVAIYYIGVNRYEFTYFFRAYVSAQILVIGFSYVQTPQMNIMIAPAYLVLSRSRALWLFILQDILNVAFILLWFQNDVFCDLLAIGCRGPWYSDSPVQWINLAKISILIGVAVKLLVR